MGSADKSYKASEYGFVIIDKELSTLSKAVLAASTSGHGWFTAYVDILAIGY